MNSFTGTRAGFLRVAKSILTIDDVTMDLSADSLTDLQSYVHRGMSELRPLLPDDIEETLGKDPLTNFQANVLYLSLLPFRILTHGASKMREEFGRRIEGELLNVLERDGTLPANIQVASTDADMEAVKKEADAYRSENEDLKSQLKTLRDQNCQLKRDKDTYHAKLMGKYYKDVESRLRTAETKAQQYDEIAAIPTKLHKEVKDLKQSQKAQKSVRHSLEQGQKSLEEKVQALREGYEQVAQAKLESEAENVSLRGEVERLRQHPEPTPYDQGVHQADKESDTKAPKNDTTATNAQKSMESRVVSVTESHESSEPTITLAPRGDQLKELDRAEMITEHWRGKLRRAEEDKAKQQAALNDTEAEIGATMKLLQEFRSRTTFAPASPTTATGSAMPAPAAPIPQDAASRAWSIRAAYHLALGSEFRPRSARPAFPPLEPSSVPTCQAQELNGSVKSLRIT